MRSAVAALGGDPLEINPQIPVDLVIDHSVQVDAYGTADAFERNAAIEFARNRERYTFLRWGQQAFRNFRVIPPASGIVHQVNLEYLATVVQRREAAGGNGVLSRLTGWHRFAYNHDQWSRGRRLGSGRYRGRGGDARTANYHALPCCRWR